MTQAAATSLLLVDDERSIREPLAVYLTKQGFRVTQAGDAASAQVTDSTYTASNASIAIEQHSTGSGDDTITYYVTTVDLSDATALCLALTNDSFGQNITENTSDILYIEDLS